MLREEVIVRFHLLSKVEMSIIQPSSRDDLASAIYDVALYGKHMADFGCWGR